MRQNLLFRIRPMSYTFCRMDIQTSCWGASRRRSRKGSAPRFSEDKHWQGLHASCADQLTRVCCNVSQQSERRGTGRNRMQRIFAKQSGGLHKYRDLMSKTQNTVPHTETWDVVDRKLDPRDQQLIITMEKHFWKKLKELIILLVLETQSKLKNALTA